MPSNTTSAGHMPNIRRLRRRSRLTPYNHPLWGELYGVDILGMDIRKVILNLLKKKKQLKVADVIKVTGFSRAYISRIFQELRQENRVVLVGKANRAQYVLASVKEIEKAQRKILNVRRTLINKNLSEDVVLDKIKRESGIFFGLRQNISHILDYAFTEMLNNAIEHSGSKKIIIKMQRDSKNINFEVIDRGVGIFNHIMRKRGLKNELEAIQDLLKGKQTTVPKAHTGEGVFFTSKAVDLLIIKGSNKKLIIDNRIDDIFIKDIKKIKGTEVICKISLNSLKDLSAIFREYAGENFKFDKTRVTIKLFETGRSYISRSQARRVLFGLEKFKVIILDFKNIEAIGQGFADEVFRVWQKRNPNMQIIDKNYNENIEFMIKRVLD